MRIRLAATLAAKLEGIRQELSYPCLSDVVNLLLDAVRGQWDLKLSNLSRFGTEEPRARISVRHLTWLGQYGKERGINIASVVNLVLSEYLLGLSRSISAQLTPIPQPPQQEQPLQTEILPKPKGNSLIKSLKL